MSSVSNGLYFLTLLLVSVMCVIHRKVRHARYLYIKRNFEKVWGARYTLGARYLLKNTVFYCFFKKKKITNLTWSCCVISGFGDNQAICEFACSLVSRFELADQFSRSLVRELTPWRQWRTHEFCWGGVVSTNSVEDRGQRENGDLGR